MRRAPNLGFIVGSAAGNTRYYLAFMFDELVPLNPNGKNLVGDRRI